MEDYAKVEERTNRQGKKELSIAEALTIYMEGGNVADHLHGDVLAEIGRKAVEGFDTDKASRKEWEKRMGEAMKLAMQVKEEKSYPYPGAANVKLPVLTVGCLQFASRALPAIVKTPYPVKGRVNGTHTEAKRAAAERMGQHMSYQLTNQLEGWVEDMDTLLHSLPIMGCEFKKTWRDSRKTRSERVSAENLVFDYWAKDVETARRKTEILAPMHPQDVLKKQKLGEWRKCVLGEPEAPEESEVKEEVSLKEAPASDEDTPHTILEQHTFVDVDGDGCEEPYIVVVDKTSTKVLRMSPRFDQDGIIETDDGPVVEPVEYYTQYKFFPDPAGGSLGLGWGHLLLPINEVINTTTNQLLDSGTWANTNAGFMCKPLANKVQGGLMSFKPNEFKAIDAFIEDIQKGLYLLPKTPPSPVLFNLLGMMVDWAQKLTTVTDTMAGESPPTNQPATTTLAMLEQGMKVFAGVHTRLFRAFESELRKIKRLNRIYLEEREYFQILDVTPQELDANGAPAVQSMQGVVFITDYRTDDTDVTPSADPAIRSEQQMIARARAITEGAQMGMPFNPQWTAKQWLDAIGVPQEEQEGAIVEPQPPQPDPKLQIEEMRAQLSQAKMQHDAQVQQMGDAVKMELAKATNYFEGLRLELEKAKLEWQREVDMQKDATARWAAQLQAETQLRVATMGRGSA